MVITKGKMQWQIQGRGPWPALPPPPPPLYLDHTEARKAGKIFFFSPGPTLSQGLDDRPPPSNPLI